MPLMRLQYLRDGGDFGEASWQAEKDGQPIRYKRVILSVSVPTPDEPRACALVLGEVYDAEKPSAFTALAGRIAPWPDMVGKLVALRRALKPTTILVEAGEEPLTALRRLLPDLRKAAPNVPCGILQAPADALGELTRWASDGLIRERRLTLDAARSALDQAPEAAARTLQCVVSWLLAHKARYGRREDLAAAGKRRARGYSGRSSRPDEPIPPPSWPNPRAGGQILVSADGKHNFGRVRGARLWPDMRAQNLRRRRSLLIRIRNFEQLGSRER